VSFLIIIGITSIIPAAIPRRIPININFMRDTYIVIVAYYIIFKKLYLLSFTMHRNFS
jgi:hypothetical protein